MTRKRPAPVRAVCLSDGVGGCMLSRAADLSKRGSLTRRIESPDVLALLSCFAAAILLVPLRGVLDAFPFVPFAAAFVLFMAPGVLLSCWFLADDVSGPAIVPVGFAISAGIFGLLGVPVLILHESIEAYMWVAGATLAAFLAVAAWKALRRKPSAERGEG